MRQRPQKIGFAQNLLFAGFVHLNSRDIRQHLIGPRHNRVQLAPALGHAVVGGGYGKCAYVIYFLRRVGVHVIAPQRGQNRSQHPAPALNGGQWAVGSYQTLLCILGGTPENGRAELVGVGYVEGFFAAIGQHRGCQQQGQQRKRPVCKPGGFWGFCENHGCVGC